MAKKMIFLVLFAACASFLALANNLSHISAPTLADSETKGELNIAEAARASLSVQNAPLELARPPLQVQAETALPDLDLPTSVVDGPADQVFPDQAIAAASEPISNGVHGDGHPDSELAIKVEIGNNSFISEWRELPRTLFQHVGFWTAASPSTESEVPIAERSALSEHIPVVKGERTFVDLIASVKGVPVFENAPQYISPEVGRPHSAGRSVAPETESVEVSAPILSYAAHNAGSSDLLPIAQTQVGEISEVQRSNIEHLISNVNERLSVSDASEMLRTETGHLAIVNSDNMPAFEFQEMVRSAVEHFANFRTDSYEFTEMPEARRMFTGHNAASKTDLFDFGEIQEKQRVSIEHFASVKSEELQTKDFPEAHRIGSGHLANFSLANLEIADTPEAGRSSVDHFAGFSTGSNFVPDHNTDFSNLAVAAQHENLELGRTREHESPVAGAKLFRVILPSSEQYLAANSQVSGPSSLSSRPISPLPAPPLTSVTNTAGPVKRVPVLIENNVAFSRSMLSPMTARPEPADLVSEAISIKGGPSASATLPKDKSIDPTSADKTLPVLISGKAEFSNDLLKPMKPSNTSAAALTIPLTPPKPKSNAQQFAGYCDANFVGEPIRFSQTIELKLEDLLNQLHARFGVNFIMGPNIGKLPLNVKAGSIPWNVLLRSQLFISGVRARCLDTNTIELIENSVLPSLQDGASVTTKIVKLKFLQRTSGGTVDLANRNQGGQNGGQGGCGGSSGGSQGGGQVASGGGSGQSGQTAAQQIGNRFDQLIVEIEKILGLRSMTEGGGRGNSEAGAEERRTNRFVTQIPGRNILAIRATEEEHALVADIIERADRAPFQVVIKALVYSANQDRLRDIGAQTTITGGTADGRTSSGVFGHTIGTGTLFDFSTIIGTFDFNVQVTALQQNGVISVKSRPFSTVLDGLCTTLNVGRELPIVIDSTLGGQGDIVFVNAANRLAVTPYVIDDENGNPVAVTLELSLDANDVDSSVTARGVPAISRRSIQTQLLLAEDKTAILGGFTVDQDSKSISKTPGLGDIPIIGELFKRRIRDTRLSRLYFAISVEVIPYPEAIAPVVVPGATTQPSTITTEMKKRAEEAEPNPADPNKPYDPKKKKDN